MPDQPIQILLIEDNPTDVLLVQEALQSSVSTAFSLVSVEQLSQALKCLQQAPFDVVLLDLSLPDSQGLQTFLKLRDQVPTIPILVLTGLGDQTLAITAVQQGAQDFLNKRNIRGEVLTRAIRYGIERKRTEQALRQAEEKYRGLFENAIEGVYQALPHGPLITANPALARMFGYASPDEMIGNIPNLGRYLVY